MAEVGLFTRCGSGVIIDVMSDIPTAEVIEPSTPVEPETIVPKVFRVMKHDPVSKRPIVGSGASELGVRPDIDIGSDSDGNVVTTGQGMSVVPNWRNLDFTRIPKRLKNISEGARGPNSTSCFTLGTGPFESGAISDGLTLVPDSSVEPIAHGVVAPTKKVSLDQFQADLAATEPMWQIEEN